MDTQVVRDLCSLIVEIRAIVEGLRAILEALDLDCNGHENDTKELPPIDDDDLPF